MTPDLGGHSGADQICQAAADGKGLGGIWMAWVSDASGSPASRFTRAKVPYLLLDGTSIASNWADLTDGMLSSPISRDESGVAVVDREVWTGTDSTGAATAEDCANWSVVTPAVLALQGLNTFADSRWSQVYSQFCDRTDVSLYCFEQ
jgi:hypothetical protein